MATVLRFIDVDVPVRNAYNQWAQFEELPEFMQGVKRVVQLDESNLRWRAEVGGRKRDWTARITEQVPGKRIAWTSTSGPRNAGVVTFHRLGGDRCRVALQLDYEPEGLLEDVTDLFGVLASCAEGDLQRFKRFVEAAGRESDAWRGPVRSADGASAG